MNRDTCGTCFAPSDLCKCTYTHEKLMEENAEYRDSFYRFNNAALDEMQALTESEYRENTLVRLSNTHQQLDAALAKAEPDEYELVGRIDGTYGGRWMLAAFAENASAVWPDGTAIYVRRVQK